MPLRLKIGLCIAVLFLVTQKPVYAVTIAEQSQGDNFPFSVWQAMQELGTNLSGTAQSFTFRVSTSRSNLNQFNYAAENSRIYDKSNNNSFILSCIPASSNPADVLRGLTFNTTGVPSGFEDVSIDFSCRNYSFIPGHRYLIKITNANIGNSGSGQILFGAASYIGTNLDYFTGGGLRYGTGNTFDFSNNSGSCDPAAYTWNGTNPFHNGCYVWTTSKDDLYFVLSNTSPPPPPPKLPVIFIPGIGGSELKASQDIVWSKEDGHGGNYSHAYSANEKIWVNQDKAQELGDDDYFDVLKLKSDGVNSEAPLSLTGNFTQFGYSDIDSFFTGMGYVKGVNFFDFNYDWRKDVRGNKDSLDALIESAKTASGQSKVNIVVHSMGGLIARYYISDSGKAAKVNKLIALGVPHLGAVDSLKSLVYGIALKSKIFGILPLGIPASEIKDTSQNMPAVFQLLPSSQYFNFYNNASKDSLYPFRDDRDIDGNNVTGDLNYNQIKSLLSNLSYNMTVFGLGEQFHNSFDSGLAQTNGTKIYEIIGTAQPTLGQIHETWWITWPINLIPKTDEIYINGDDTVPLYSASLKNDSTDISGATKLYYVEQKHSDLVNKDGTAMKTVKSILDEDNALPVEVKDQKISLDGEQLSLDDGELDLYDDQNRHCGLNDKGEIEQNIPEVICTTSGNTKHSFVKKKAAKVKVKVTRKKPAANAKTTNLKIRTYKTDKISKTIIYKDIVISDKDTIEFNLDPSTDTSPYLPISSTSEVSGDTALDLTAPKTTIAISGTKNSSGVYDGPITITLTGTDSDSGVLRIEYSLDNGQTVQIYTGPFIISAAGKTTIQFKAIDKLGNEEIPQTLTIEIAVPPTPTPSPTSTPGPTPLTTTSSIDTSSNISPTPNPTSSVTNVIARSEATKQSSNSLSSPHAVLGINFEKPSPIPDQINTNQILSNLKPDQILKDKPSVTLGSLLIISGSIGGLIFLLLLAFIPSRILSFWRTKSHL